MSESGALYEFERDRLIGHLGRLTAAANALRALIAPLKETQAVPPAAALSPIATALEQLRLHADALRQPLAESPALDARAAGAIEVVIGRVAATEREAAALAPAAPPADAAAARAAASLVLAELDGLRDASLTLTVPYEVKQLLRDMYVGRALEFATVFKKEELPSAERRKEMLEALERRGGYLDQGVVDVPREIIWRKSGSGAIRVLSCFSPILFAAITVGVLLLIGAVAGVETLEDDDALLKAFAIVLLGTIAHLLVENVKLSQARETPILAIGEFVDWLHLRWAGIGGTFFAILVTVLGLRLTLDEETLAGGWETTLLFFFAGYSVDSVAGIFLTRFGTAAKGGVAAVTARIKPAEDAK